MKSKFIGLKIFLSVILIVVCVIIIYVLNIGSTVDVKSSQANFIEEDGVITFVELNVPAFPSCKLIIDKVIETINADDGSKKQIITTYRVQAEQTWFLTLNGSDEIVTSDSIEYIYNFEFADKTIVIKNGIIQASE